MRRKISFEFKNKVQNPETASLLSAMTESTRASSSAAFDAAINLFSDQVSKIQEEKK